MKLKDFEIGQLVLDQYGNEYEVLGLDPLEYYVQLRCTKYVKRAEICKGVYVTNIRDIIFAINTEYLNEKYNLKSDETKYITTQSLKHKSEYILDKIYIENNMDKIFDKVSNLERHNSCENAFYLRKALCDFKDSLLDAIKLLQDGD